MPGGRRHIAVGHQHRRTSQKRLLGRQARGRELLHDVHIVDGHLHIAIGPVQAHIGGAALAGQGQAGAHVQPDGRAGLAQRLAKHIVAQHPEQAHIYPQAQQVFSDIARHPARAAQHAPGVGVAGQRIAVRVHGDVHVDAA